MQELRLAGISDIAAANVFLLGLALIAKFANSAPKPHSLRGSLIVALARLLETSACATSAMSARI